MWLWIAVVLAVKLALLLWMGPLQPPDTSGYLAFSQTILAGQTAQVDLSAAIPNTLFRVAGYPAILALTQWIAGGRWNWLIIALQITLSLTAAAAVYKLGLRCRLSSWLAAAASMVPALSLSLQLDQAVLTDSLYSSLMLLAICGLVDSAMGFHALKPTRALLCGCLIAASFLLREATTFLCLALLPLIGFAAWKQSGWIARLTMAFLVLLPLALTQQAYKEWNRQRTGIAIVTTGAQTTMFQALFEVAAKDPSVLEGDDPVMEQARKVFRKGSFDEVLALNAALNQQLGMDGIAIAASGYAHYFSAWRHHPLSMLHLPANNLRIRYAKLWLQPVESLHDMLVWQKSDTRLPTWKTWRHYASPPAALGLLIIDGLCNTASIVVFAGFLLVTPYRVWCERRTGGPSGAALGILFLFAGFVGIYGIVHIESRYLAPLVSISSLIGIINLEWLHAWLLPKRNSHKLRS
ncbi:MAG TPA: hypothetical protein VM661_17700 [Candidatus Sulfotelmatobacter sp.]|nr:hypothetical protein [Candidatus Sulfotelmatobacter sp.]